MFRVYQVIFHLLLLAFLVSFIYVWTKLVLQIPIRWKRKTNRTSVPKTALVILIVSIAGVGSLSYFMAAHARSSLTQRLAQLSSPYKVTIDGEPAGDPDVIIAALKFSEIEAHHSHPTKRIVIEVEDRNGSFKLVLARDSDRASEYWVYSPQYDFTRGLSEGHEIGRIDTEAFKNY